METTDREEVSPPWIVYPGFPPGDGFWRQSGEAWFAYVWEPFWGRLSESEQETYLDRWKVPDDWRRFYFDKEFRDWLDGVDD